MPQHILALPSPIDLAGIAFTLPLFSLVLAALIVAGGLLATRLRHRGGGAGSSGFTATSASPSADSPTSAAPPTTSHSTSTLTPATTRYRPEHLTLGIGSLAVILVFAAESIVRGYLLNLADIVEWWQYATPLFAAALCLAVTLALIVVGGTHGPQRPVTPAARRTWLSFSPRAGLIGAGAALLALVGTTIGAGLASSSDDRGRFIYLEIPVPNTEIEPLRPWFYGWDYGVPVLICLAALAILTWATLRRNAMRPYLRPETVTAERQARVHVASGTVTIATAAMLLALGGAFRFIGRYGSLATLENDGATYDMVWQYAEFAAVARSLAPALEIVGFALLLFVAIRLLRRPAPEFHGQRPQTSAQPETVR